MKSLHRWAAPIVIAVLLPAVSRGSAALGGTVRTVGTDRVVAAIDLLQSVPVALEHRGGYDRSLFTLWLDADGDGCDARAEVLRRDTSTPVRITSRGCTVIGGTWVSAYDGLVTTEPWQLEIDHVVALKEAWDSGAWAWTAERRAAFANDLTDPRTLRGVTTASNRSKGDRDPSNWLPMPADQCRFIGDWVAIKVRWGLSADQSEWGRIRNVLRSRCPGLRVVAPTRPKVADQTPLAAVAPVVPGIPPTIGATTQGVTASGVTASGLTASASSYPNCATARAAGVAPLRRGDPGYRSALDRNGDGVACEG